MSKALVQLCHKRSDNYVCCICDIGMFVYPKRLKNEQATKLINSVIMQGWINTKNWKSD